MKRSTNSPRTTSKTENVNIARNARQQNDETHALRARKLFIDDKTSFVTTRNRTSIGTRTNDDEQKKLSSFSAIQNERINTAHRLRLDFGPVFFLLDFHCRNESNSMKRIFWTRIFQTACDKYQSTDRNLPFDAASRIVINDGHNYFSVALADDSLFFLCPFDASIYFV